jgi:hypothetical protein
MSAGLFYLCLFSDVTVLSPHSGSGTNLMNKKVINVIRLLSILFVFALVGTSHATDWYVSPAGSDSNSGTSPSTPFQTLNKGRDMAQAGDTVYIMNGTYYNPGFGTGNVNNLGTAFLISKSGSAEAGYLTFKNFPGHTPKIKYDGASGITVSANVHHVIIEGLEIEGPAADITYEMAIANRIDPNPANYYNNRGIVGWGPNNNIIVRNCFAHDTCSSGIRFNKSDYMTIEDCQVARTCWWSHSAESGIVFAEAQDIDSSTGIKMIMRRNLAYDNWNRIPFYNGAASGYGSAEQDWIWDGQGLYVTRCQDYNGTFLLENNICVNNGKNGISFDHSSSAAGIIVNNTLYYNGAIDFIQTEWPSPNPVAGIAFTDVGHATVANNIIVCRTGYYALTSWDGAPHTVEYNLIEGGSVHSNVTLGAGNIFDGAGMVNPSTDVTVGYYSLAAGSPCIDAADAAYAPADDYIYAARPFGAADDIGALERISGNSAPTWNADPFYQADASLDVAYSSYIDWRVTDLDGDTLTYAKVSGPAWATVSSPNGNVQGTPAAGDVGLNTIIVSVSDGINPPVQAIMYITVQESFPAAPIDLVAAAANNMVSLDWNDNSETYLAGYNIYRSQTSGSGYKKINSSLLVDSNYVDNDVDNFTTYYYVVTAVDTNNNDSGYSNEASATPDIYQNCIQVQLGGDVLVSDLTGDCYVNLEDLEIISVYWLDVNCVEPDNCGGADFEPVDGDVDLQDFSDFAMNWLLCNDPVDSACIKNWWP